MSFHFTKSVSFKNIWFLSVSTVFFMGLCNCALSQTVDKREKIVTVATELEKFINPGLLPLYEEAQTYQISTADTTGDNEDGFSGKFSFLRKNQDSSLVIFDSKGPGVINRIWTPTPTDDTLDFYIDSNDRVTFSIKYNDLFSGKVFPFLAPLCGNELGGYYCYLPIPFQQSCKIVFKGEKPKFHQIQYKLFDKTYSVKSFSLNLTLQQKDELERVQKLWGKKEKSLSDFPGMDMRKIKVVEKKYILKSGGSAGIFKTSAGGRILGIEFLAEGNNFADISNLFLKATWDNEKVPAIFCPLKDFLGYYSGRPSMQSLLVGSDKNKSYCYIPMPYSNAALIEIVNSESDIKKPPVQLRTRVFCSTVPRNKDYEGAFYAYYNKEVPETGKYYQILKQSGKGHLVGSVLQVQGLKAGMTLFFEGDDATVIDGKLRISGTGSEDYFNGGWYAFMDRWDANISLPLHGSLGYTLPLCRTGGYRFYMTDKISFEKSITQQIEHGPVGNRFPAVYRSVAYYYLDKPDENASLLDMKSAEDFKVPDTLIIYPQLAEHILWDSVSVYPQWLYDTGGLTYLYTINGESRVRYSLKDIPYGKYKLFADYTSFTEGCSFSVWQRQIPVSEWVDTRSITKERKKQEYLCLMDVNEFKETLTLRFKTFGNNNKLILSRLILVKVE